MNTFSEVGRIFFFLVIFVFLLTDFGILKELHWGLRIPKYERKKKAVAMTLHVRLKWVLNTMPNYLILHNFPISGNIYS